MNAFSLYRDFAPSDSPEANLTVSFVDETVIPNHPCPEYNVNYWGNDISVEKHGSAVGSWQECGTFFYL